MMAHPEPLSLDVHRGSGTVTVALRGELDPHTAPQLQDALDAAGLAEAEMLVLDLEGLVFVDSSGLRVIIAAYRQMTAHGGRFVLRAPSDSTRRILEVTGLEDLIEVQA